MTNLTKEHTIAHISAKKGFRIHLIVFLVAIPINWLLWYLTDTSYPWPVWQTPLWAIGVLFHYLAIHVFKQRKKNHKI